MSNSEEIRELRKKIDKANQGILEAARLIDEVLNDDEGHEVHLMNAKWAIEAVDGEGIVRDLEELARLRGEREGEG